VLRGRWLVVSRTIGRADECKRVKPRMARDHEARDQGLQRDRIDRNQRRGFSDQPRHGEPS